MELTDYPRLAEYRHTVAESYARVRANPDPIAAATQFRAERDHLFKTNPLSPIPFDQRATYAGVPYAAYDGAWRFEVPIDFDVEPAIFETELPEGLFRYRRFGRVHFTTPAGETGSLALYWIQGYGGGLFLPFGDATNKNSTYGGGRYLYDSIKGADLGVTSTSIILDFNFAYHPSCRYSHAWLCPLTLAENRLPFAVPVGELMA